MKTLSIKQPWASLIAAGIKDIENRTWRTKHRGRIYIHASSKPSFDSLGIGLTTCQINEVAKYNLNKFNGISGKNLFMSHKNTWIYSAIIGEVDIIDCVLNHESIWAEKDCWNWVLANPILYDKPILNIKGALSLWEYERPDQVIGTAEMVSQADLHDANLVTDY